MTAGLRRALRRRSRRLLYRTLGTRLQRAYDVASLPVLTLFLFLNPRIHPAYRITWRRKARLAWRMWRTTRNVFTGTSYRAHLAIAVKLMEVPPSVEGVVVECGAFLGGSTANLSLVCDIVGRRLIVYDSFEGLPAPAAGDQYARAEATGRLRGDLDLVREHVRRFGALESCEFRKGWFSDTLPKHSEPIVACFLDVDYQASLHDCVLNLWPWLTPKGYVFIDEYVLGDYCALFWSERYWRTYFDTTPPGLLGAGTGIGLGQYYTGPFHEWQWALSPSSVAYTRKDLSGYWAYYPEDERAGASSSPDEASPEVGAALGILREAERQGAAAHARGGLKRRGRGV